MSKSKQARLARQASLNAGLKAAFAPQVGSVNPIVQTEIGCRWARDIAELAQHIEQLGEKAVSNSVRNLVVNMLPAGSVTRRDGSSIRPRYRESANA